MKYIENIKYCLLLLFSRYGNIVDINITISNSLRLDAFILYEANVNAKRAVQNMQGFRLFGMPLRVRLSSRGDTYSYQRNYNQVVPSPSTSFNAHGADTPPPSPNSGASAHRNNVCPLCGHRPTSVNVHMNAPRDLNVAGPSREYDMLPAQHASNAVSLPTRYSTTMPYSMSDENDVCLYVSNIPGNDMNATHYVAVSLFQGCVGFQCVYVVPNIRGAAVISFWTSAQARLAMSVYDGHKIDNNNLRLQISIALTAIIHHIHEPDFNPIYYMI